MYNKFDIRKCNTKEIAKIDEFKKNNPEKSNLTVYYTTEMCLGMGFSLIATFDKPKVKNGIIDFGNYVDITDYDYRLDEF